jgi:CelD/BcsL family acetyltransferase involved in cellulose biosynthesis
LKVTIARLPHELERLRAPWRKLFASGEHTRFQCFEWNELAAQMFAPRQEPAVVYVDSGDGAAIIPAAIDQAGELTLLGDELFDYRDVLHRGNASALHAAFQALSELGSVLSIKALRDPVDPLWPANCIEPFVKAPAVRLGDAETFVHPRLGRNFRRLLHQGCTLREAGGMETGLLRRIYRLKAEQGGNLFTDPLRLEFMCQLAHIDSSIFDIFTLEHEDAIVAALVTFRDGKWRRFYTTYFDERWAKFSPGLALLHEIVQRTLAQGLNCDLMTGEQPYKLRLATTSVPLYLATLTREQMQRRAARSESVAV